MSLYAFVESGCLERLRAEEWASAAEILGGSATDTGQGFIEYLRLCGVLDRRDGRYRLSPKGTLLTSEISLARLGFYLEAYAPVTARITDLITNKAEYGRDVVRAGGALSRHSGTVATVSYVGLVAEAIAERQPRRILDIGCGDGSLILRLCARLPELSGVGIDISPAAIENARADSARDGLADRTSFEVADAFSPDTWSEKAAAADVLVGVGVMHELFRDGEDAVIEVLNRLADVLTEDKVFLLGEPELRYDNRENDSDFFLVHVLTGQGIPRNRTAWLDVFRRSRLRCKRVITNAVAGPRTCFYELTAR
ncbi:SAM-dependent methyltransferase [Nocardiopsis algeriensis]|uniref:SAM-dependent methyltransferase n=1 Tax=Nocardiopsis algeriensis TaxID=1478215 RepID=A0A841IWK5_9ACTN|nr:class I SAM-dependent methyltransferase [Nocardiopsis algeriensis]MBB6120588.1 SAM-dependent methyltransferase [Nocardiopsis algeriensis]